MIHELEVWPAYYERLVDGSKTFEVRKDDRGYQTGDTLQLCEWFPPELGSFSTQGHYTGRMMQCTVGFIFRQGFGCDLGEYVVMSLIFDQSNVGGSKVMTDECP